MLIRTVIPVIAYTLSTWNRLDLEFAKTPSVYSTLNNSYKGDFHFPVIKLTK